MLASFLMGLVGGQRAMTPLASVALASACGKLPSEDNPSRFLSHPLIASGTVVLALAEMAGDKQKSAPDRVVPIGLLARFLTCSIAGAALSTREHRVAGGAVAGFTAIAASYLGWRARVRAMEQHGQTQTGIIEDLAVVSGAFMALQSFRPKR